MIAVDREHIAAALPGYDIGGQLGRGGWGVVLEGRHRQLQRDVAIKQLPPALAADPQVRARFVSEARLLAAIDHPHVVPIYDYVEDEDMCLLVMEKLTGGTVWERFRRSGLSMQEACAVLIGTCAGLHCAHTHGILHRDVKPENVMFSATGTLKVTDFGIAKIVGGSTTMTSASGEVLGTPAYIAPEQAEGRLLTPATDVYACGVLLYELLAGRLPYSDEGDAVMLLYRHVHEDPEPLGDVAPNVPGPLVEVTMRALRRDPAERFPTAEGLGRAVAEAAESAWGAEWLTESGIRVMATGAIPGSNGYGSPRVLPRSSSGSALQPPPAGPVSPSAAVRGPDVADADGGPAQSDGVPAPRLDARMPGSMAPMLASVAMLIVALVVAFSGPGRSSSAGNFAAETLMVGRFDPTAGTTVPIDLAKPIVVKGTLPAGSPAVDRVELQFRGLGFTLGRAAAATQVVGGSFSATLDASRIRYLVAGQTTASVVLSAGGKAAVTRDFIVKPAQPIALSAPGGVSIALVLFVVAYAESLLRSLRRGRRGVPLIVGVVVISALTGVATTAVAWLAGTRPPTPTTLAICAVFCVGSGILAAQAAARVGQRRRLRAGARGA